MARSVKMRISRTLTALALLFQCFTNPAAAQAVNTENPQEIAFYETESGQIRTLADFSGKKTVLHFWATWCAPCVRELPQLVEVAKKHQDIHFILVSYDKEERGALPRDRIQSFMKRMNIVSMPTYWEKEGVLARTFRISNLPATIVLDENGREINRAEAAFLWHDKDITKRFLFPKR